MEAARRFGMAFVMASRHPSKASRVRVARMVVAPARPAQTAAMMGMFRTGSRTLESPRRRPKPVEAPHLSRYLRASSAGALCSTKWLDDGYPLRWTPHQGYGVSLQIVLTTRSLCLRVSGAVAPSAPNTKAKCSLLFRSLPHRRVGLSKRYCALPNQARLNFNRDLPRSCAIDLAGLIAPSTACSSSSGRDLLKQKRYSVYAASCDKPGVPILPKTKTPRRTGALFSDSDQAREAQEPFGLISV